MSHEPPPPPKIVVSTDLRSITRRSKTRQTCVDLHVDGRRIPWLRCGEANLRYFERPMSWQLGAYLSRATDPEHDSAYALRLPLVGLTCTSVLDHVTTCNAWVAADADRDFHVPRPGYDPAHHADAVVCGTCKPKHRIVPEGFYVPPFDGVLYRAVSGLRVTIEIGPAK